jgi:hypothetical protein
MLGKTQWFQRRKYAGWGIAPKTYQGWLYLLVLILGLFFIQFISWPGENTQVILMFIWAGIFVLDTIDIMIRMPRDERDRLHEAFAERNALWVMITVLVIGISYRTAQSMLSGTVYIEPVIIIALFAGLTAKAITNIYLDKKD